MKKFKFLWLPLFAIVGLAGIYFLSCQRDAEQPQVKPLSDKPVGERACLDDGGCSFVITAATNCTVELCGDILNYTGTCSNGCNTKGNDHFLSVALTANTPYTFCVYDDGSVCVRNPSTATQDIDVAVQVAGTTAINVTIPVGQSQCFHSDDQCSATFSGCF
ncbi:MAG: hypothetical protein EPGJADBJ_05302 [Saprospiraceae bacterium]|nr:hypothetical protein [Saprospiraceae bacterium]